MKKAVFVVVWMAVAVVALHAQNRLKRKADALYDKLSYELAIPYYEHYLKKNIDNDATMKLADCYRLTHDYENAAKWYDKVLLIPGHPSMTYFYYGHALLQTGDLENARQMFSDFAASMPHDKRGKNFLRALDRREELLKDSVRIEVTHLPFNSELAEFGTFPYQDGIIFASAREAGIPVRQTFNWLDTPFLNFFFTSYKKDSAKWERPVWVKGDVNSRYHESNFTMATGTDEFFFTRNNYIEKEKGKSNEGIIKLKLYKGKIAELETSGIEELGFNSDEYSTTHPSISADGQTLYFVSDMPGGVGGKDIYFAEREGDGWSAPMNLLNVNTPGDEMFPFIHPDGMLFFSSDGHPGLGHLDIFYVKLSGDQQVVNMGYPINTAWDDFAFYLDADSENGFLSSDRPGGDGDDDIYKVFLRRPMLEIIVLDSIAQLPIQNAKVILQDLSDNTNYVFTTDSMGMASFKTYYGHQFDVLVETEEFAPRRATANTIPVADELVFTKTIQLWSPPPAITGIVIDDQTKARLPGAKIEFVSLRVGEKETRTADHNGRFHIKLEPFTYYEMSVRHPGYLAYTQRVSTTYTAFDGDTIIPLKMERIVFNKPVRLENIKYDFDKWTIRADAYNDLIYLAELMKKNPTIIVELGSHTDSRGSDKYNEELSQKRANAARIFLIDLGIDPKRITAKGYGEYQLSNCCYDGEPCTEKEHQRNRRTEFKIIGTLDGVDMANSKLETNEAGNFNPLDCGKGKPKAAPVPVKKEPVQPPVKPVPTPKRDSIASVWPLEQPTTTAIRTVNGVQDSEDVVNTRSGDPVLVRVTDKQVKVDPMEPTKPVTEPVAETKRDTIMKTRPAQPTRPVAEAKRDTMPLVNPVQPTWPVAEAKRDTVVKPQPVQPSKPIADVKRDPNSVQNWLGDTAPVGGDTASVSEESEESGEFVMPDFKTYERPAKIGNAITYRVQIGAFRGELSPDARQKLGNLAPYVFSEPDPKGPPRVYVGEYLDVQDVKQALEQLKSRGYPNAVITGFRGGLELSTEEMRLILHEIRRI